MGDRGGYRKNRKKKSQGNIGAHVNDKNRNDDEVAPRKKNYRHGFDEYHKL